ncbi:MULTISPECIES: Crp/Fnr family transcriptional regulator [unclassified Polaribacter]|uniref:Crp/Fnr family transcriptional regulator n=1 Tax=unclassified Polaribacter TaxID=196858 RepID=UPI0011BE1F08|nr:MULTISPECIES: Crp/Fnr family transcriptional regulator [unclassified Polaribacter]TXD53908.1 Crp/Fnr family transcriptional regulator [Polaribacter sp. IC063]TXD58522.1 Crp/Fnr family transcriptional regulator [Polaribacter sp. IC066]
MFRDLKTYITQKTNLQASDIDFICGHFTTQKTKRNQILINYYDICEDYYFINKGAIRLFTVNKEGLETSRYFAFENMFCTALPSFIDQQPALEYLQTIEASDLLIISRNDFYTLVNTYSEFDKIYREILELGFITAQKRIYGFQGFDALEKVQWLIQNQPNLLLRVSNKMAASYLGISPSTLSRVKKKL